MIQFLGDIAGMLEIFAIAAGMVLLHMSRSDAHPGLLKGAGWLLVLGGVIVGACTLYYWFDFRAQGALDAPYPAMSAANGPDGS